MAEAYLTIDDSPSPRTDQLLDFLAKRDLQALFFCRGDFMELYPAQVINIIQAGHVLGNHLYSHTPASQLGYDAVISEIEKTEALIAQAYKDAGIVKPGSFLRFPYLDRGDGAKNEQRFQEIVTMVQSGSLDPIDEPQDVLKIQKYLKENNYFQPFKDVNHPLYQVAQIREAADCLLTFTSYDWMLSARHLGREVYTNVEQLKEIIDNDSYLLLEDSVNIVLFHDDRDGVISESCALIDHMLACGLNFKDYNDEF